MKRPCFYINNNIKKEVKAAGIIFYRYSEKYEQPLFLIIKDSWGYCDFGGKSDIVDKSIEDIAIRETYEESNGVLKKKKIQKLLKKSTSIYIPIAKYLMYFCELKKFKFKCKDFGDIEIHDNLKRKIKWLTYKKLLSVKKNLQFRLKNIMFFKQIEKIKAKYEH